MMKKLEDLTTEERNMVITYAANGWNHTLPTHLEGVQLERLTAWEMILDECPQSDSEVLLSNLADEETQHYAKNAFVAWCINGGMPFTLYDEVEEVWQTDTVNPYYSLIVLTPPAQFEIEPIRTPFPVFLSWLPASQKYSIEGDNDVREMLNGVVVNNNEVSIKTMRDALAALFGSQFLWSRSIT